MREGILPMREEPESDVATAAMKAAKAQIIRGSAEGFVDMMARALVDGGHTSGRESAYREVAVQATFNATVMYEALPESLQKIFSDTLRGDRASDG